MLFAKIKDNNIRKIFAKNEYKIKQQKYSFINLITKLKNLSNKLKKSKQAYLYKSLYFTLAKKKFRYNKIKIINRCVLTNRSRGVTKLNCNTSRNAFRELLQFGLVPGYKKAVW